MAGIGFELKKIFKQGSILATLRGVAYASLTTIGPMILIMAVLLTMYGLLGYMNVPIAQRELLSSTILYCFIFSMVVAAPVGIVMSRFIADKIFEERPEDILPSYYTGLVLNLVICAILGVPFIIAEVVLGGVEPVFAFVSYCLFSVLVITFFSMTYVTALKEFRQVTYAYVLGMALTLGLGYILEHYLGMETTRAILYAFTAGFTLTALLLFAQVRSFFRENSRNYRETLRYFVKFRALIACNLMYTLGLYMHNFIFWDSNMSITVAAVLRSAPAYDMATCLAMFTNISLTIIFIVRVETRFHEKYQSYCEAVIGGRKADIDLAKRTMFHTLTHEMWFIIQMQLVITVALFFVAIIFLPMVGIGGLTLTIYPVLAAAYLVIFVQQSFVVFLYYFEDIRGALFVNATYLFATIAATIFAREFLPPILYGMGAFVGAFAAWTVCYFRLRSLEKRLDRQIFCRGQIVKTRSGRGSVSTLLNPSSLERREST